MASLKSSEYVLPLADPGANLETVGGKGASLARLVAAGLPVPAGFTITTDVCTYYYDNKLTYPKVLDDQVAKALKRVDEVVFQPHRLLTDVDDVFLHRPRQAAALLDEAGEPR